MSPGRFEHLLSLVGPSIKKIDTNFRKAIEYTRSPKSETEWLRIADEFKNTWNLEHCIRAIDGKHIYIENRSNTGS